MTMKLYAFPMSCSFGPQVALDIAGIPHEIVWVRWPEGVLPDGRPYSEVNPRMQTPALELEDGKLLTETPAILQYIADRAPDAGLAPANGTFARTRLQEMLNYLSSELHKQVVWPLANLFRMAGDKEALRAMYIDMLCARLDYLQDRIGEKPYLLGNTFSVADPHFMVLLFAGALRLESLDPWPGLQAYNQRLLQHEAVARVHALNIAERQRLQDAGRPV